ncbi:MAG TPA: threonine synthase [Acidimicrobiia bacterium]|jgi:threonine synthase|nr:threonine synthase [Acidimicrobiia bacterium]
MPPLICSSCSTRFTADELRGTCERCGSPLLCEYEIERVDPVVLETRSRSMWRYREVLPEAEPVTLGEGWTPLVAAGPGVWIKDESVNPTGSFKDRGMAMAVTMARHLGAKSLAAPSAGNAAVALAAFGFAAGLTVTVALPDDTPSWFVETARSHGATVHLVEGTIGDAGAWLRSNGPPGAFDVSTLREPYRIEGKKTMAYELWEQLGRSLPDVILYPTGGGTGLIGIWRAFGEMERLGWIGPERPRMVSAQVAGCDPVVTAFTGSPSPIVDAKISPTGLRVPSPLGLDLCVGALTDSHGTAVSVDEGEMWEAAAAMADVARVDAGPESGAAWAAYKRLLEQGWIKTDDRVAVFNTGSMTPYQDSATNSTVPK